jgi:hypothetical protein
MCRFFSAVILAPRDGGDPQIRFTESDSHNEVIRRMGLNDGDLHIRHFVRVEMAGDEEIEVDETSVPSWYGEHAELIFQLVQDTKQRVVKAKKGIEQSRQRVRSAYNRAVNSINRRARRRKKDRERRSGEFVAKIDAQYLRETAVADRAYDASLNRLTAAYVKRLSPISGYVPAV